MKSVLLMVHDDPGQEGRTQCALDVARAFDAKLLCLDLLRAPIVVDAMAGGMGQGIVIDERDQEDAHVVRVEAHLEHEDVGYEWARMQGAFDAALSEHARLSDLIVVSRAGAEGLVDQGDLPGRVARLTSAPILVVPPGQKRFDLFGRALVAWDGSLAASAAVRAAAPLLAKAESVEVLTIGDVDRDSSISEVCRYLARYRCKVTARRAERHGNIGEQIVESLSAPGIAWGVMGAYGHSALREALFGGTTKTVLAKAPVPLVISH